MICDACKEGADLAAQGVQPEYVEFHHSRCKNIVMVSDTWCDCQHRVKRENDEE